MVSHLHLDKNPKKKPKKKKKISSLCMLTSMSFLVKRSLIKLMLPFSQAIYKGVLFDILNQKLYLFKQNK